MFALPPLALPPLRRFVKRSRAVYTPLSLLFLGYLLASDHESITRSLTMITPATAFAVITLIGFGHIFIALASFLFLQAAGRQAPFRFLFHTHVDRLPARYLPGGIWQTVSRAVDFSNSAIPSAAIVRLLILEMGSAPCLGAVIGGALLLHAGPETHALSTSVLALIVTLGAVGLVVLPLLLPVAQESFSPIRLSRYAGGVAAFTCEFILRGAAFYSFVVCLLPILHWDQAAGTYWLSWVVGFLAFFAPQGIGVFEGTSSYLLTGSLAPALVTSMFAFRALSVLADVAVYALYHALRRLAPQKTHQHR